MLIRHQHLTNVVGVADDVNQHRPQAEANDVAVTAAALQEQTQHVAAEGEQVAEQREAGRPRGGRFVTCRFNSGRLEICRHGRIEACCQKHYGRHREEREAPGQQRRGEQEGRVEEKHVPANNQDRADQERRLPRPAQGRLNRDTGGTDRQGEGQGNDQVNKVVFTDAHRGQEGAENEHGRPQPRPATAAARMPVDEKRRRHVQRRHPVARRVADVHPSGEKILDGRRRIGKRSAERRPGAAHRIEEVQSVADQHQGQGQRQDVHHRRPTEADLQRIDKDHCRREVDGMAEGAEGWRCLKQSSHREARLQSESCIGGAGEGVVGIGEDGRDEVVEDAGEEGEAQGDAGRQQVQQGGGCAPFPSRTRRSAPEWRGWPGPGR